MLILLEKIEWRVVWNVDLDKFYLCNKWNNDDISNLNLAGSIVQRPVC